MKVNEISQAFEGCLKRLADDYSKYAWDSKKEIEVRYWSEFDIELWLAMYCIEKFGQEKVHIEVQLPRKADEAKEQFGMTFDDYIRGKRFDIVITADPYKFEKLDLMAEITWTYFHPTEDSPQPSESFRRYYIRKVREDLRKLKHARNYCKVSCCCIIDEGNVIPEELIKKWKSSPRYSGVKIHHLIPLSYACMQISDLDIEVAWALDRREALFPDDTDILDDRLEALDEFFANVHKIAG